MSLFRYSDVRLKCPIHVKNYSDEVFINENTRVCVCCVDRCPTVFDSKLGSFVVVAGEDVNGCSRSDLTENVFVTFIHHFTVTRGPSFYYPLERKKVRSRLK